MIAFDLKCSEHHEFEAWFKDREAFEDQKEKGLIACPVCGSRNVEKILSPVAIKKTAGGDGAEVRQGFLKAMEKIYDTVIENTEDVGSRFTTEALKMHYGATEPRNIRGVATEDEEKLLNEEGIEFARIPVPANRLKKEKAN